MRLLVFACGIALSAGAEEALLRVDFENKRHPVAQKILKHPQVSAAPKGGRDGSEGIRIAYSGYERGSKRVTMQFELAKAVPEATLEFDILFEEDFQFVHGGKLFGLGPADPATGGEKVTPLEWSARLMFGKDGRLQSYNYHQHIEKYGMGREARGLRFKKNRWYRIQYHVKLNDPPSARNGSVRLYVDGKPVLSEAGLQFRSAAGKEGLIRRFLFHTFHGGSSRHWAPVDRDGRFATVHARVDRLAVHAGGPAR